MLFHKMTNCLGQVFEQRQSWGVGKGKGPVQQGDDDDIDITMMMAIWLTSKFPPWWWWLRWRWWWWCWYYDDDGDADGGGGFRELKCHSVQGGNWSDPNWVSGSAQGRGKAGWREEEGWRQEVNLILVNWELDQLLLKHQMQWTIKLFDFLKLLTISSTISKILPSSI